MASSDEDGGPLPTLLGQLASELESGQLSVFGKCSSHAFDNNLVRFCKKMAISRPEILRATRSAVPLQRMGRLLRTLDSSDPQSLFDLSYMVDQIDQFWSHSWHGKLWQKIAVLLVLENGTPAVVAGAVGAFAGMVLTATDVLPALLTTTLVDGTYECAPWSLWMGIICSVTVFFLWRPDRNVFCDRVCIHQTDIQLKKEGVANIGAFLKNSRSMLVLWDPTYVRRLWCVFEIAAFIRSQSSQKPRPLIIRPVLLGPCTFMLYGSMALVAATYPLMLSQHWRGIPMKAFYPCLVFLTLLPGVHAFRSYFRGLELLMMQLRAFSVQAAACTCCELQHRNPATGQKLLCDRVLVEQCINSWYGGLSAFEASVRSSLGASFQQQLGQYAFRYSWCICASSPYVWCELDFAAAAWSAGHYEHAVSRAVQGLATWLWGIPVLFACLCRIARILRRKRQNVWWDASLSCLASACLMIFPFSFVYGAWIAVNFAFPSPLFASSLYAAVVGTLACAVWLPNSG
eukprot:gb/GFBE01003184.1/.p1 GENE.gb/GFBE01003184.1/~~gb/GFBE01003184.1/.p1  ORF type:complete len:515 (+),score=57.92 gb/GFBE01003184.1/:1-1545(+)